MNTLAWQAAWRRCVIAARRIVGIPDYDAYVAHLRTHHPGMPIPARDVFFADRQEARFRNGGDRCC